MMYDDTVLRMRIRIQMFNVQAKSDRKSVMQFSNGGTKQCCERSEQKKCLVYTPTCDNLGVYQWQMK